MRYAFLWLGVVLSLSSCKHEPFEANEPEVSFKKHVSPIIIGNCTSAGCHGDTTATDDPMAFIGYNRMIANGEIEPGRPEKSDLWEEINKGRMPPSGRLNQKDIDIIYYWIKQGAKNN
jgi:hypothetical protein